MPLQCGDAVQPTSSASFAGGAWAGAGAGGPAAARHTASRKAAPARAAGTGRDATAIMAQPSVVAVPALLLMLPPTTVKGKWALARAFAVAWSRGRVPGFADSPGGGPGA